MILVNEVCLINYHISPESEHFLYMFFLNSSMFEKSECFLTLNNAFFDPPNLNSWKVKSYSIKNITEKEQQYEKERERVSIWEESFT